MAVSHRGVRSAHSQQSVKKFYECHIFTSAGNVKKCLNRLLILMSLSYGLMLVMITIKKAKRFVGTV